MPIEVFVGFLALGLFGISIISQIFIAITLDRRLKKEFQSNPDIIQQTSWYFRIICIALNVVFKNRSSNDRYMNYHYKGFDFRGFASPFERMMCFTYTICSLSALVIILLCYPAEYFGFIDLDLLS